MELWLFRTAGALAGLIVVLLIIKLIRKQPCWLVDCRRRMKHLSIEKRYWPDGKCHRNDTSYVDSYRHRTHLDPLHDNANLACFVTKWICTDCGKMGYYCVGDEWAGAWTIEHGQVVPDEKQWAQWLDKKKTV